MLLAVTTMLLLLAFTSKGDTQGAEQEWPEGELSPPRPPPPTQPTHRSHNAKRITNSAIQCTRLAWASVDGVGSARAQVKKSYGLPISIPVAL